MATLEARLTAVVQRIRDEFNAVRTALAAKANAASPQFTGNVRSHTYGVVQEVGGDIYHCFNAIHDGTNWMRIDTTKPAWMWQINMTNNMIYEGYKAMTLWTVQPGENPIAPFTNVGGWFMASSMSEYKDFTLAGAGIEVDGNFTLPYGRLIHNTIGGVKKTGIQTNYYLDESGRDDTAKNSWFFGIEDSGSETSTGSRFVVRRAIAGAITAFQDLLSIRADGQFLINGVAATKGVVWSITGKTVAAEVYPGVAPYAFGSTTARSFARARVAATASTVFTVKKNGTTVATVTFAAAATVGTWSANVSWADGDLATIDAPATPDTTLADIVIGARE